MSISTSLHRAAQLQEKIDALRVQLTGLIDRARSEIGSAAASKLGIGDIGRPSPGRRKARRGRRTLPAAVPPAVEPVRKARQLKPRAGRSPAARALKAGKRSPLAGRKRASSPSGPLAPAVVRVLKGKRRPMNVRDILSGLLSSGYEFSSPEPKRNLAARIYRLKGVKQVGGGLFASA
jgi:hypothetical protein